jgi:hypothetical protein
MFVYGWRKVTPRNAAASGKFLPKRLWQAE